MRYLTLSKSGNWYFRYQISAQHRHLFGNRHEVKKSLRTSCKQTAVIKSLQLELEIRTSIQSNTPLSESNCSVQDCTVRPQQHQHTPTSSLDPFKCLSKYREFKREQVSPKTLEGAYAKCFTVLKLLEKKGIKQIRRMDAEEVRNLLSQYPVNARKHKEFNGLDGKALINANKKHRKPTLSPDSVKDYLQKSSSFFEWCVQMELTDINPFKGIKFKKTRKDSEAKSAYSEQELEILFSTEIHTQHKYRHAYYYWLPILGALTDARLNELYQLYKADVIQVDEVWAIQIDDRFEGQKLKNNFSRRIIPLHEKIIELGFIDYIQKVKGERIFPELKNTRDGYGSAASKWFARHKTKLSFGRGYDFHSFRHTVATQLKQKSVSPIVAAEILGHAQNNITYDRYGKNMRIQELANTINFLCANFVG
ncbi:tyrosine-type recombinase/integrase [Photobacterium damselae]